MYADDLTIIPDPKREDASDFVMVGDHAWLTIGGTSVYLALNGNRLIVETFARWSEAEEPMDATSVALTLD